MKPWLSDLSQLEALYGKPGETSLAKEVDYITDDYRAWIEASPFAVLATVGAGGLDASPRGDRGHLVVVADSKTLYLPDRRGNNRLDSLRNIVEDPRVALLFLLPGLGETLRVNGQARLSVNPELCQSLAMDGKLPRSVIVISVEKVYFQCARAVTRSALWDSAHHLTRGALPSPGRILEDLSGRSIDGATYDRELPGRQQETLY